MSKPKSDDIVLIAVITFEPTSSDVGTGEVRSRVPNQAYRNNYETIFGKKESGSRASN